MDYYKTLGLTKGQVSTSEITKAYRRLAKEWHPDKHQAATKEQANKKFKEISEAHSVLSDPEKRKIYDQYGADGLKQHESMSAATGRGRGGINPMDGFFSPFGHNPFGQRNIPSIKHTENVSLETFFVGTLLTFKVPIKNKCHSCDGSGCVESTQIKTCGTCRGSGKVVKQRHAPGMPMIMQQLSICHQCHGKGKSFDPKHGCQKCGGEGRVSIPTQMEYMIKPGEDYGQRMLPEKGDYLEDGCRGNLILSLEPPNEKLSYQRNGPHLVYELSISLIEALYGFNITIPYPDPNEPSICLTCDQPTSPNTVKILKGKGMPISNSQGKGDIILSFKVIFPEKLKAEAYQNRLIISQSLSLTKPIERVEPKRSDKESTVDVNKLPIFDEETYEEELKNSGENPHIEINGQQCAQQ